jgi:hypothetical protein
MKKLNHNQILWFVIINAFIFLSTVIASVTTLSGGTISSQVEIQVTEGWMYIATFTVLSNLLLGAVALFSTLYGIRMLRKKIIIPRVLIAWYLVAASATMLTMLTVILFLGPLREMRGKGYFSLLGGPMFFFHLLNPLLAATNYVFFMPKTKLKGGTLFLTLIPPMIYAAIYAPNVIIFHTWHDFYGFTFGGNNWAVLPVFTVILLATFGTGALLDYLRLKIKPF